MPRKNRAFKIDERLLEALERLARKSNISANKYLENLLMAHAKQLGEMPMNAEPLGETRGGDRSAHTKPKNQGDDTAITPGGD